MSARIIAFCNQKGGVAKTTSTINTGAALAKAGKRVLLVDCDPQGSLTVSLGIDAEERPVTTYELLLKDADAADAIIYNVGSGYDVIPADLRLSAADLELVSQPARETLLREALRPFFTEYDYILVDCPPSLSVITVNCLTVANEIIIPQQAHFLAVSGLSLLLDTVEVVRKRINKTLSIRGVILTMFDGRTNHAKEVREQVREFFGDRVFTTAIRNNIALADAPARGMDVYQYAPTSNGAADYTALAGEIMNQEGKQ